MRKADVLFSIFLPLAYAQSSAISLPIHTSAPTKAAVVDQTFAGFAFEQFSFYQYFGNSSSPNQFSVNLLSNVANRTNGSTVIRVGGTSLDDSYYNPQQKPPFIFPPGQKGQQIPHNVTFGPSFFSAFHNIPFAKYVFSIPFAHGDKSNSTEWAKAGYKAIGAHYIAALELGNEPNLYSKDIPEGARSDIKDPHSYVTQWASWTSQISTSLGLSSNAKIWDALTYSASAPIPRWSVNQTFTSGNLSAYSSRISTCSLHYYQALHEKSGNISTLLLDHAFTTLKMANFSYAASFLASQTPPIPLDLAEVGPSIDLPPGAGDLGGVFGTALWIVDMLLHGMSTGIRRINYQQILGSRFSLWQPITLDGREAHVKPGYYGPLFAAEFRGREEGVSVEEVDVGNGKGDKLSAYEAWNAKGDLLRVAIVNLEDWNAGHGTRPNVTVHFGAPQGWKKVEVRRLESRTGVEDSKEEDISYAGVTYTFTNKGQGKRSGNGTETIIVKNGNVTVNVRASEAVMILKAT